MFLNHLTLSFVRRISLGLMREARVARKERVLVDHLHFTLSHTRDDHFVVMPEADHGVPSHPGTLPSGAPCSCDYHYSAAMGGGR